MSTIAQRGRPGFVFGALFFVLCSSMVRSATVRADEGFRRVPPDASRLAINITAITYTFQLHMSGTVWISTGKEKRGLFLENMLPRLTNH